MKRISFLLAITFAFCGIRTSHAVSKPVPVPTVPDSVRFESDVAYLPADRKEKADLYFPKTIAKGARLPAVLIIHGGGFNDGDKAKSREVNYGVNVALKGYVGMSINYKLRKMEGQMTWPQNLHDCKTAVRWLRKNAERLNIAVTRCFFAKMRVGIAILLRCPRPIRTRCMYSSFSFPTRQA